jgi:hypothetical protein
MFASISFSLPYARATALDSHGPVNKKNPNAALISRGT